MVCEPDAPKFAGIVEGELAFLTVIRAQGKDEAVMFFWLNFTCSYYQISTHTQMYKEIVIFELKNQVLCPP
jgi:hypothetical protein